MEKLTATYLLNSLKTLGNQRWKKPQLVVLKEDELGVTS